VPEADGKLRFWRDTDIATLGPGQIASLPRGTLGYEWDEDLDNGARPAGLMHLSTTTVAVPQRIQDYGSTYAPGTATHHLTLYRASSGALVFGAGTVQWSWGLDDEHDRGSESPDARMQQATVNLLADMGLQPATLQGGLVTASASTDATPPSSAITAPANGATVQGSVAVSGTAADAGGAVGAVEVSSDGGATWQPAAGRESWSFAFVPPAPGALHAPEPRGGRQRQSGGAGARDRHHGPGSRVPVQHLGRRGRARGQPERERRPGGRAGAPVPCRRRRLRDRPALLRESLERRAPHRSPVDERRNAAGRGHLRARWFRLAAGRAGSTGRDHGGHDLRRPYHTPGYYVADDGYFTSGIDAPPLRALADGEGGANGVYAYGPPGSFPDQTFQSSNYWIDVVFADGPGGFTLWDDAAVPLDPAANAGQAIEVGAKFRAEVAGEITALRFYKGAANTGSHVGHLWTAGGALLAEAAFTGETSEGWQEVALPAPVAIAADTTYIASYHSDAGLHALDAGGLASGIENRPLRLLADGEDGGNGVFALASGTAFPDQSGAGDNYWVDVRFVPDLPFDADPPEVTSILPGDSDTNVPVTSSVSASFDEALDPASISGASFELRDAASALVAANVSYDAGTRTATLAPDAPLAYSSTHTATLFSSVSDLAGNPLTAGVVWSFTTADAPPAPPDEGPGGPILVVASAANPFGRYFAEILRNEGLNYFTVTDISLVDASVLAAHELVILAETSPGPAQVAMFTSWVDGGGKLVAMRRDPQLASLLGLAGPAGTLADAYLQIDTALPSGSGLVAETLQFHGTADLWSLAGASALATLYSDASTATANPAATLHSVGSNGGLAAAFLFDLARSVVYTRQGNPAWAGQERDGSAPIRSDDLFFGAAPGDPQPDWIDLGKVAIPQADEQQRMLAKLIRQLMGIPLPAFWYFPSGHEAVVLLTADQHGCCGATRDRFDDNLAASAPGCSVDDWECVRSTSYIYAGPGMSDAEAAAFTSQGFEIGVHVNTNCADWTPASLDAFFAGDLAGFAAQYPSLPAPDTNRTHCIAWSDWSSEASVSLTHGVRLDTNYYYWPPAWVADTPGMFTGSGMIMRFAEQDGTLIDVYQAATQMTDESGQSYPFTIDTLLDRALGAEEYYGASTANMHTDGNAVSIAGANAIVASAQARGVPVVTARQMLQWLDGRNGSSFADLSWNGASLSFALARHSAARNLQALVPTLAGSGPLVSLTRDGQPVPFLLRTIKAVEYAAFAADSGEHVATYGVDATPPAISSLEAVALPDGTATVSWSTDEPADSRVAYGTDPGSLAAQVSSAALTTGHAPSRSRVCCRVPFITTGPLRPTPRATTRPSPLRRQRPPASSHRPQRRRSASSTRRLRTSAPAAPMQPSRYSPSRTASWRWPPASPRSSPARRCHRVGPPRCGSRGAPRRSRPATWSSTLRARARTPCSRRDAASSSPPPSRPRPTSTSASASRSTRRRGLLFSTGAAGTTLRARSADGTSADTDLGASLLGTAHRFRIEWGASSIDYFVDGLLAATHAVAIGSDLRPLASDLTVGGPSLAVDWLRMSPYATPGRFDSRIFDAGSVSLWDAVAWTAELPSGVSSALSLRVGDSAAPDASWSAFAPIGASGDPAGVAGRYAQYRVDLATSDPGVTPLVEDVSLACAEAPDGDGDGLPDAYETGTGSYVSPRDTGTSASLSDTDGDGFADGVEVGAGTDPNDPGDFPASVPAAAPAAITLILAATGLAVLRRRLRADRRSTAVRTG